jgi:Na+-transporting NADH:ubiquinone oxidoreductase subunit NqrB
LPGGGRLVYLGSQRISLAVVSLLAMARGEGGAVLEREGSWRGVDWAVLAGVEDSVGRLFPLPTS